MSGSESSRSSRLPTTPETTLRAQGPSKGSEPGSMPAPLRGIIPPMVTPLSAHDELDQKGLGRLVEHLVRGGVAGIFALGTTGEGPSMSYRLRYELVERVCELVAGRVPVLVSVSDSSLEESLELSHFARDCGANGVVATPPYYFPISENDLTDYFLRLADASALPVFLYNMPACVKVSISQSTAERCTAHSNILGIKDSGGSMDQFRRYLQLASLRSDWTFLIGPEHLTTQAVLAGGHGGVNGGANLLPRLFVDACNAARLQQLDRVAALQQRIEAFQALYAVGTDFVAVARGLKWALGRRGICNDQMAAPFHPYGDDQAARLQSILDAFAPELESAAVAADNPHFDAASNR